MADIQHLSQSIPNGETIAYRVCGEGPETLVLVHGNVSTSFFWANFMKRLPQLYRTIAVDLRGAGNSSYVRPVECMSQFAEDIVFLLDELGVDRFHLTGLSMGGLVCQQLAADHPGLVKSLILVDSPSSRGYPVLAKDEDGQIIPGCFWKNWSDILNDPVQVLPMRHVMETRDMEIMKTLYSRTVFNVQRPEEDYFSQLMEEAFSCRNYPDCLWPMHIFNASSSHNGVRPGNGHFRNITMPVMIVYGENDILVPEAHALSLASDLGERAVLKKIAQAGHIPFVDNEDAVLDAFTEFLATVTTS